MKRGSWSEGIRHCRLHESAAPITSYELPITPPRPHAESRCGINLLDVPLHRAPENVARFIHVNLNLELDLAASDGNTAVNQWQPLIWTTGDEALYVKRYGEFSRGNVIKFLTFDAENPNSIISCVKWARENARSVREVISSEMWITLNRFYLMLHSPEAEYRRPMIPIPFIPTSKRLPPFSSANRW